MVVYDLDFNNLVIRRGPEIDRSMAGATLNKWIGNEWRRGSNSVEKLAVGSVVEQVRLQNVCTRIATGFASFMWGIESL